MKGLRTMPARFMRGTLPTLQDFHGELLQQLEQGAKELALAIELFTKGSLNTFAKHTNVDTNNSLICFSTRIFCKLLVYTVETSKKIWGILYWNNTKFGGSFAISYS